jgi:hypothetical protein
MNVTHNNLPEAVNTMMQDIAFMKSMVMELSKPHVTIPTEVNRLRWLPAEETASALSLTIATLYKKRCNGDFPEGLCKKVGNKLYFNIDALNEYINGK